MSHYRLLRSAIALVLPAALLGGCITFRTVDDGIDRARIGQTVGRLGVSVMPLGVVEDSRCPRGVTCIQAGTVRIVAEVNGARTELALDRPVSAGEARVSLVEAYPARLKDLAFYPDEYRFEFRISR